MSTKASKLLISTQNPMEENSEVYSDAVLNLSLLDTPRWGWSAIGGVIDLCPPHERARRISSIKASKELKLDKQQEETKQELLQKGEKKEKEEAERKVAKEEKVNPHNNTSMQKEMENLIAIQIEMEAGDIKKKKTDDVMYELAVTDVVDLDGGSKASTIIDEDESECNNDLYQQKEAKLNDTSKKKDSTSQTSKDDKENCKQLEEAPKNISPKDEKKNDMIRKISSKHSEKIIRDEEGEINITELHKVLDMSYVEIDCKIDEGTKKQYTMKENGNDVVMEQGKYVVKENAMDDSKERDDSQVCSRMDVAERKEKERQNDLKKETPKSTYGDVEEEEEKYSKASGINIIQKSISNESANKSELKKSDDQCKDDGMNILKNKQQKKQLRRKDCGSEEKDPHKKKIEMNVIQTRHKSKVISRAHNRRGEESNDYKVVSGLGMVSNKHHKVSGIEGAKLSGEDADENKDQHKVSVVNLVERRQSKPEMQLKKNGKQKDRKSGKKDTVMKNKKPSVVNVAKKWQLPKKLKEAEEINARENATKKKKPTIFTINPMNPNGTLNIFAYHRGISGNERRCDKTHELLCQTTPTDTNHFWDDPELKLKVIVEFPLQDVVEPEEEVDNDEGGALTTNNNCHGINDTVHSDNSDIAWNEDVDDSNNNTIIPRTTRASRLRNRKSDTENSRMTTVERRRTFEKKLSELPKFRDEITWDLSDPSTPTPMIYATDIAAEFGLSLNQTLDLAASIQSQIDKFVSNTLPYQVPIASEDPTMIPRHETTLGPPGFAIPKTLYGGHCVSSIAPIVKSCSQQKDNTVTKTFAKVKSGGIGYSRSRRSNGGGGGSVEELSAPKRKPFVVRSDSRSCSVDKHQLPKHGTTITKYSVEFKYVDEVLRRAKNECTAIFKKSEGNPDDDKVGKLSIVTNGVCHICHCRKPQSCQFSCKFGHLYCDKHCKERLGFSVQSINEGFTLNFCPVCCLQCLCAKCVRRLNSVSSLFKAQCNEQGLGLKETAMEILPLCLDKKKISEVRHRAQESNECLRQTKPKPDVKRESISKKNRHVNNRNEPTSRKKGIIVIDENELTDSKKDRSLNDKNFEMKKTPRKTANNNLSKSKRNKQNANSIYVTKLPASQFPMEITNGKSVDPSLRDDYFTIFTPIGSTITTHNPAFGITDKWIKTEMSTTELEEDGNVDYCLICGQIGGIICCDKCPRAFHGECLKIDKNELPECWECPRCFTDKTVQDGDIKKGLEYFEDISNAFITMKSCPDFSERVLILSKVYEILSYLLKFDFGSTFSEPVNCESFPDYLIIVEKPMDIGTICSNLIKGKYVLAVKDSTTMDSVILEVLKDIERVWHNCFLYNCEASSVYRMAKVQRKRCDAVLRCSIYNQLSPYIQEQLEQFTQDCKLKREKNALSQDSFFPQSKYTIPRGKPKGINKVVGVFDPETKMLVKQYSSVSAAVEAVSFILKKLPNNQGTKNVNLNTFRCNIRNKSPKRVLFGYRWLFVQDLRDGNFIVDESTVSKVTPTVIYKKCIKSSRIITEFDSIRDAYEDWLMEKKQSLAGDNDLSLLTFQKHYLYGNSKVDSIEWTLASLLKPSYSSNIPSSNSHMNKKRPIDSEDFQFETKKKDIEHPGSNFQENKKKNIDYEEFQIRTKKASDNEHLSSNSQENKIQPINSEDCKTETKAFSDNEHPNSNSQEHKKLAINAVDFQTKTIEVIDIDHPNSNLQESKKRPNDSENFQAETKKVKDSNQPSSNSQESKKRPTDFVDFQTATKKAKATDHCDSVQSTKDLQRTTKETYSL